MIRMVMGIEHPPGESRRLPLQRALAEAGHPEAPAEQQALAGQPAATETALKGHAAGMGSHHAPTDVDAQVRANAAPIGGCGTQS